MSNELTLFKGNAPLQRSSVFNQVQGEDNLGAGISAGFAKITYKGSKWAIKYQGQTVPLRRMVQHPNGAVVDDGPNPFLDCVIIEAAGHLSKYYYEGRYNEGDNSPPDCWSSNGQTPDAGAPKKQSATCVGCKWNAWGSRVSNDPSVTSKGKQCTDHKRLAIVPAGDILNKVYGGPMLLQVPPTSLKKLEHYSRLLQQAGFRAFEVWTRISFDPDAAHPLMKFDAIAPLNDQQAQLVLQVQEDPLTDRILNVELVSAEGYDDPPAAPPPPTFQQPTAAPPPPPPPPPAPQAVQQAAPPPPPPPPQPVQQAAPPPPPPPPQPVAQPDPLTIPPALDRRVETAAPPPPPPGISPEEWAAIQRMRGAGAGTSIVAPEPQQEVLPPDNSPSPRRRNRRTAPVSPQPHDSAAAAPQPGADPSPPPAPAAPVTSQGNGAVDPDVGSKIGAMIQDLL